jgi:GNAT superfamily N-acetyltransferase
VEYAEAHAFLTARGFSMGADAVAMGMPLEGVRMPEPVKLKRDALAAEGTIVRPFERADTLPLLTFTEAHFPHWTPSVRDSLAHGGTDVLVAVNGPETQILAYAQWQNPHNDPPHGAPGRFGPFGVRPDLRSQGIGAVVFYTMIERAAGSGSRYLWFGWAGGRNLSFYERAGCVVTRRFQLYRATV